MTNTRYAILACVVTLMCIGIVAVYSGGASLYGAERGHLAVARKQMIWIILAAVVMVAFSLFDYHLLKKYSGAILILAFVALVLVHLVGVEKNNARRWLPIGSATVQPAEFFKIAIVIYMARFLSTKQRKIRQFLYGFLPPMILATLGSFLIVMQPDFGTALLIAIVVYAMVVVAGVKLLHALIMLPAALPLIGYLIVAAPYRLRRIMIFLDPWKDQQGAGYQITQSLIAFGSGGLTGVGPGLGMQKGGFTPEHLSDFIFSVIGEEMGFVGTAGVVLIYVLLLYLGSRVVRAACDSFGSMLAFGILLTVALQTVINIGVVTCMLPTKGLPLPFISAGGSSMIAMAAGIGIVLNVALHAEKNEPIYLPGAQRATI
ncbi:MAG: putative lipid II flippase FtsW [Planctomycetes bacterium]|jgi:cell division protein FtsW|nr:putative lipid II flippase FtsW [Planctomycetota bacterium]